MSEMYHIVTIHDYVGGNSTSSSFLNRKTEREISTDRAQEKKTIVHFIGHCPPGPQFEKDQGSGLAFPAPNPRKSL